MTTLFNVTIRRNYFNACILNTLCIIEPSGLPFKHFDAWKDEGGAWNCQVMGLWVELSAERWAGRWEGLELDFLGLNLRLSLGIR